MNSESPVVSICIVTFGALARVQAAIEAVRSHTSMPYQLVVFDNGSTDVTREWLRENLTVAQYIESPTNSGFSGGNNLAVNHATAPFVCLLNSDTVVPPLWIEPLIAAFDHDPNLGIAVPMLLNENGSVQEAGCHTDADGRAEPMYYGVESNDEHIQTPRSVVYGSAACWVLRTSTYREFGGLDCGYGLAYYEDVDFASKLRARGLRIQYVPGSKVVHAQGASSNPDDAVRLRDAQQRRFAQKHATNLAHHSNIYDLDQEPHRFAAARDVDCATRTLHVLPTASALNALYNKISTSVPFSSGHHTLCNVTPQGISLVSRRADVSIRADRAESVITDHLFHFSMIRASQDWLHDQSALLTETQPQSEWSSELPSDLASL